LADVVQKPSTFFGIAEIGIVKVMRVPVDENSTEIEDDIFEHTV